MTRILSGDWKNKKVFINGREIPLERSMKYFENKKDQFSYGHFGNGNKQLAFAIIYELTDDSDNSMVLYKDFCKHFISGLPFEDFSIEFDLEEWIQKQLELALKKSKSYLNRLEE
jgi:hypothetical protein